MEGHQESIDVIQEARVVPRYEESPDVKMPVETQKE